MYGNMSSVEKAMNKYEMQAYKNFDARQYALVPGLQHTKEQVKVDSPKIDYEDKFKKKQNYLQ